MPRRPSSSLLATGTCPSNCPSRGENFSAAVEIEGNKLYRLKPGDKGQPRAGAMGELQFFKLDLDSGQFLNAFLQNILKNRSADSLNATEPPGAAEPTSAVDS